MSNPTYVPKTHNRKGDTTDGAALFFQFSEKETKMTSSIQETPLERARRVLYAITGGAIDSGDVRAAKLSTRQRIEFFKTPEFRDWVASEKAAGREIFWLKDVDKTQAAGDIFTFFFKWRADNKKFTKQQLAVIERFLLGRKSWLARTGIRLSRGICGLVGLTPFADSISPYEVLRLWNAKEEGGRDADGIGLLDFWSGIYWPTQVGLTEQEKKAQVKAFAETVYATKVYPGVPEENRLLESLGVHVVIVSNGDQELARAASDIMGIKPENVVGSHLKYENGIATGVNHSYEVFDEDWAVRPQPGKPLSFHYWLHVNRGRWGWKRIDERKFVIAGRDGDSASADGGMMILLQTPAIGNFMVDTPGEPERLARMQKLVDKYGWTPGQFITLVQEKSLTGRKPE